VDVIFDEEFGSKTMALKAATKFVLTENITDAVHDAVIVVSHSWKALEKYPGLKSLYPVLENYSKINASLDKCTVSLIPTDAVSSHRLFYSSTGTVNTDFDDVRRYQKASTAGVKAAVSAGVKFPLLITIPYERFSQAELVSAVGGLHSAYTPYHIRSEDYQTLKLDGLGIYPIADKSQKFIELIQGIERSFIVSRDIGDGDPQRMAPPKVAEYVQELFKGSSVKVTVDSDQEKIKKEYPLLAAVNRSANDVPEHQARIIWLEYSNEEEPKNAQKEFETLMLVGKGVTLDTGGVDVKTGGHMYGMSRDKYGAAVVAGFFEALNLLKPKGLKVKAAMCMVRNSIGSNAYTCDEIIVSRSKKRIAITNTDAEGRLAMLDPLTKMREEAGNEKNPHLYTIATLTGHEVLSYGYHAAIMDNGPARALRHAETLQHTSDIFGQPMEISRLHSEDIEFNNAQSEHADIRQGNTLPSVQTLRGHMSPAAFLIRGSRIDEHGIDSTKPIKYTHLDIGSCMTEAPHVSYPNPLFALIGYHILPRLG
jgi:leucyl aminopeptidase